MQYHLVLRKLAKADPSLITDIIVSCREASLTNGCTLLACNLGSSVEQALLLGAFIDLHKDVNMIAAN